MRLEGATAAERAGRAAQRRATDPSRPSPTAGSQIRPWQDGTSGCGFGPRYFGRRVPAPGPRAAGWGLGRSGSGFGPQDVWIRLQTSRFHGAHPEASAARASRAGVSRERLLRGYSGACRQAEASCRVCDPQGVGSATFVSAGSGIWSCPRKSAQSLRMATQTFQLERLPTRATEVDDRSEAGPVPGRGPVSPSAGLTRTSPVDLTRGSAHNHNNLALSIMFQWNFRRSLGRSSPLTLRLGVRQSPGESQWRRVDPGSRSKWGALRVPISSRPRRTRGTLPADSSFVGTTP